jgi:hypothetical protein
VGGIESVTLSDEEARRRGTQKSVLERRAPPTFDVLIEIQERQKLLVHHDVSQSVDKLLRGRAPDTELRYRDEQGAVQVTAGPLAPVSEAAQDPRRPARITPVTRQQGAQQPKHIYAYGVAHNRLDQVAARLRVPLIIVDDVSKAHVLLVIKSQWNKRPRVVVDAERRGLPIYVLRSNTAQQIEKSLVDIFDLEDEPVDPHQVALHETQEAIEQVMSGAASVDLAPQNAFVRRLQHELVRQADLVSHSYGKEPRRRVRVYRA